MRLEFNVYVLTIESTWGTALVKPRGTRTKPIDCHQLLPPPQTMTAAATDNNSGAD